MRRGLRILLSADTIGGVWQYSLELARGLTTLGIETVLAVLGPPPSAGQRAAAHKVARLRLIETGLPLDWLAENTREVRCAGAALAALATREEVDVVQLNGAALAAEAEFAVPVLAVQHSCVASWWEAVRGGDLPADFGWRTGLVREGLQVLDTVVTPTAAFGNTIQDLYALRCAPVTVHNGRTPLALRRGASHDCVVTVGRLWDEGKNLRTLDAAAARLTVPLYAAGPIAGPSGKAIAFDAIHWLGELEEAEIGRWLSARPVFASAAIYEPFGLAVLEAAAAGCPLVLSDIPTFRELWDGAAIFVDPRDAVGLAGVLDAVIGDELRRHELGRAACERAACYRPDIMAGRMAAIYAGLLGEDRGSVRLGMAGAS